MADFELSAGRTSDPPTLPLEAGDLIMISQFRSGAWATGVMTIGELMAYLASAIELNASRITDGTLPIARGGTNATTAEDALANLGAADLLDNNFNGNQVVTGTVSASGGFDIP